MDKRSKHTLQESLKNRVEHEHNFALTLLRDLGELSKDVIELRARLAALEKRRKVGK